MKEHRKLDRRAYTRVQRENYMIDIFVRGQNGTVLTKLGIESNIHLPADRPISVSVDIDSFFYVNYTNALPLKEDEDVYIYYRPIYKDSIKKDNGIFFTSPFFQNPQQLSQCPNVLFAKSRNMMVNISFDCLIYLFAIF
jgi:hypothetical protein